MAFSSDEDAIQTAVDVMLSMCNPGQHTIVSDSLETFEDWCLTALEDQDGEVEFWELKVHLIEDMAGRLDKWDGSKIIWEQGYDVMSQNYGWHDREDEAGEGTGA